LANLCKKLLVGTEGGWREGSNATHEFRELLKLMDDTPAFLHLAANLQKSLEWCIESKSRGTPAWILASYPQSILPQVIDGSVQLNLTTFAPEEFTRQLCLQDFQLYRKVSGRELARLIRDDEATVTLVKNKVRNIWRLQNRYRGLRWWVIRTAGTHSSRQSSACSKCASVNVKWWLEVLSYCIQFNNLHSGAAIFFSLRTVFNTTSQTDPAMQARLAKISGIYSPDSNYAAYKKHLYDCNPPMVPWVQQSLRDLLDTAQGQGPNFNEKGFINVPKMLQLVQRLQAWYMYMQMPYQFHEVQVVQDWINEMIDKSIPPTSLKDMCRRTLRRDKQKLERELATNTLPSEVIQFLQGQRTCSIDSLLEPTENNSQEIQIKVTI
jgi:hypothetical protein